MKKKEKSVNKAFLYANLAHSKKVISGNLSVNNEESSSNIPNK